MRIAKEVLEFKEVSRIFQNEKSKIILRSAKTFLVIKFTHGTYNSNPTKKQTKSVHISKLFKMGDTKLINIKKYVSP